MVMLWQGSATDLLLLSSSAIGSLIGSSVLWLVQEACDVPQGTLTLFPELPFPLKYQSSGTEFERAAGETGDPKPCKLSLVLIYILKLSFSSPNSRNGSLYI